MFLATGNCSNGKLAPIFVLASNSWNRPDFQIKEDTLTVSRHMRAASPPASAADILDATNNRRNNRPGIKRSMMTKQSSLDDVGLDMEGEENEEDLEDAAEQSASASALEGAFGRDSPRPGTPIAPVGEHLTTCFLVSTAKETNEMPI